MQSSGYCKSIQYSSVSREQHAIIGPVAPSPPRRRSRLAATLGLQPARSGLSIYTVQGPPVPAGPWSLKIDSFGMRVSFGYKW